MLHGFPRSAAISLLSFVATRDFPRGWRTLDQRYDASGLCALFLVPCDAAAAAPLALLVHCLVRDVLLCHFLGRRTRQRRSYPVFDDCGGHQSPHFPAGVSPWRLWSHHCRGAGEVLSVRCADPGLARTASCCCCGCARQRSRACDDIAVLPS